MLRKSMLHILLCALVLAAAPAAVQAQCPTGLVGLDLKTGVGFSVPPLPAGTVGFTPTGALAPVPVSASCPAAAGWKKAALQIVIPAGCTQANVVVEFEGQPKLWTVNLGDSATNDGFAGGAPGTTANNAELWILNEDLSLANAGNNPAVINNPLAMQHLALTNGALKFVVKNQFVSWGNPYSVVQAPATTNLFAIPDSTALGDQRAIYLGLNRVITNRPDRVGCGARRVLISFQ